LYLSLYATGWQVFSSKPDDSIISLLWSVFRGNGTYGTHRTNGTYKDYTGDNRSTLGAPGQKDRLYAPERACKAAAREENREKSPRLTMNKNRNGKSQIRVTSITLALALVTILNPSASTLRAQDASGQQQTVEDATKLLTSGQWRFHGVTRTFLPDGTFKSQNGNVGTWKFVEDQLEIDLGTIKWRFFLPLDPKGTRGEIEGQRKEKKDLLVKVPS